MIEIKTGLDLPIKDRKQEVGDGQAVTHLDRV